MKLELLLKMQDFSSEPEDPDEKLAQKVIREINNQEEETRIIYKSHVIDIRDVTSFGEDDNEHTKLIVPYGVLFARVPYEQFFSIYEAYTGTRIKSLNDFHLAKKR